MRKLTATVCAVAVATLASATLALADGSEALGPPSAPVAGGTGIVAAGVGMQLYPNLPNSFSVNVPGTVKQVLLYWEGHWTNHGPYALHTPQVDGDNTISVNGIAVTGTKTGGSTPFFTQDTGAVHGTETYVTYRADITSLNLVATGANTLTINDMLFDSNFLAGFPFDQGNDGAGVLVVYDDGTGAATIGVRDGLDLAYYQFGSPLDTTVAQTFTFPASATPRTANLATLAGDILGSSGPRANQLSIAFAPVGAPIVLDNPWESLQGLAFDALNSSVVIPAGATSMTVQALSAGSSGTPASLAWGAAGLSVPPPPPPESSTLRPGYWKNHLAPVSSNCRPRERCSKKGPWTSSYLPQRLGNYSVGTTAKATAIFAGMKCGRSSPQNAIGCLAGHLLAAKLNVANGADTCIVPTIGKADSFLKHQVVDGVTGITYTGPATYTLTTAQRTKAIALKSVLDAYNNGACP